ncbi:MAG: phosphate ABC transporter permease PstA [Desulfobacteraceae bacterium]|nr:phosphate ABC transporter permease PstA [Desulfobacteraceae bacterium]
MDGLKRGGFGDDAPRGRARFRAWKQGLAFTALRFAALINCLALAVIVCFLFANGWKAISWSFITQPPVNSMTQGGIFPCIVGTFLLSLGAMAVALALGTASAIYLHEYARPGLLVKAIKFGVNNLAGIPSIVFGLFGLAFFVTWFKFGVSLLSGILTLGILILPILIGSAEEALAAVPQSYREASLALGASRWQTIYGVVLPAAAPGILTGAILGVGRAAGETAAIMFTAAVYFIPHLPGSLFDQVMALPYHIYVLASAGTQIDLTRPIQYGTALVLIVLVLGTNLAAILYRAKLRR